jgi:hypothetical protein
MTHSESKSVEPVAVVVREISTHAPPLQKMKQRSIVIPRAKPVVEETNFIAKAEVTKYI